MERGVRIVPQSLPVSHIRWSNEVEMVDNSKTVVFLQKTSRMGCDVCKNEKELGSEEICYEDATNE